MWVAKFTLKDEDDIYTPLCIKHKVEMHAYPHTHFIKDGKINLVGSAIISGKDIEGFIKSLKRDKRVKYLERHDDFILVHAQHPVSREAKAEITTFYNPQYILPQPIYMGSDGLEHWEVSCIDRKELNKIVNAAIKHYHGKLISLKQEKIHNVASLQLMPYIPEKQLEAIKIAYREGYYFYPRKIELKKLAKLSKKAYSTFQENLSKAESKIVEYFLKYR